MKDMVARFVMAEQKGRGVAMPGQQPVKARQIGRGPLLSSLMEKFETMATVHKGSDLKCLNERPSGGVKVTGCVKQRVDCRGKEEQRGAGHTVHEHRRLKQVKSKCAGQPLNVNDTATEEQEQRSEQAVDDRVSTRETFNQEDNPLTAKEIKAPDEKGEGHDSTKHKTVSREYVKVQSSGEDDGIQSAVQEHQGMAQKVRYGSEELLCSIAAVEWSLPEPQRLSPQVEASVNWYLAATLPCSSMSNLANVDSSFHQYSGQPKPETFETPFTSLQEKVHAPAKEAPDLTLRCSPMDTNAHGLSVMAPEGKCIIKPQIEGLGTAHSTPILDGVARQNLIPQARGQGDPPRLDQTHSCPKPHHEAMTPVVTVSPSSSDTSVTDLNTRCGTSGHVKDPRSQTPGVKVQTSSKVLQKGVTEGKRREREEEGEREEGRMTREHTGDTIALHGFKMSAVTSKATLEDSQTPAASLVKQILPHNQEEGPKYRTINYDDPSVKHPYKPQIIHFTDTFPVKDVPILAKEVPDETLQCSPTETNARGLSTIKPQTEGHCRQTGNTSSLDAAVRQPDPPQASATQRRMPKYLIPRANGQEDLLGLDQKHSCLQPAPHFEAMTPVVTMDGTVRQPDQTQARVAQKGQPKYFKPPAHGKGDLPGPDQRHSCLQPAPHLEAMTPVVTMSSGNLQEEDEGKPGRTPQKHTGGINALDGFKLNEVTSPLPEDSQTPPAVLSKQVQPQTNNHEQRPKYRTINYGDPSLKQTYKPKIIRFTDTFTF